MPRIVVIGLGRFGTACARHLYDQGAEVLAVDRSRGPVEEIKNAVTDAVACDATNRANLEAQDVGNMDVAVVALASNFEASVLVTLHCRELGVPRIVAKATNALQKQVLQQVGAGEIVMPEEEMGSRLAEHILRESVLDFVSLPDGFSLRRVAIPEKWFGSRLADLRLLAERQLNIIQIVRPVPDGGLEGAEKKPLPHGESTLAAGDLIDVIGPDEVLDSLEQG